MLSTYGGQCWGLKNGAGLHDHSALYTPAPAEGSSSPAEVRKTDLPVQPGAVMPPVKGCSRQDYQVLIVIGKIVED